MYKYHELIDNKEMRWSKCTTVSMRESVYNKCRKYNSEWLKYAASIDIEKLNKNNFGVTGFEIKWMVKEILAKN